MKRKDWEWTRLAWASALIACGREIGKDKPLYDVLGSVAYGRYDGEPTASDTKDNVVFGAGFLQGVRFAALNAGQRLNLEGTVHLERIHQHMRDRA